MMTTMKAISKRSQPKMCRSDTEGCNYQGNWSFASLCKTSAEASSFPMTIFYILLTNYHFGDIILNVKLGVIE